MLKDLRNILLRRRNNVEVLSTSNDVKDTLNNKEVELVNLINDLISTKYENVDPIDKAVIDFTSDMPISVSVFRGEEVIDLEADDVMCKDIKLLIYENIDDIKELRFNKLKLISTVNKNFEGLGYSLTKPVFDELIMCSNEDIVNFHNEYLIELENLVGADVKYVPMYKNFPSEVMDMSEFELYFNAIVHYWSFGTYFPVSEEAEKEKTPEHVKYKYIGLGTKEDVDKIITNIMSAGVSMSPQDKEDIEKYTSLISDWKNLMPSDIPNKENMVTIANLILNEMKGKDISAKDFNGMFKTATDVLRFIVVQSGGKVTLEALNKVKYPSFSKKERKLYMSLLDEIGTSAGRDISKYMNAWTQIANRIHPGDFKDNYPNAVYALSASYEMTKEIRPLKKEMSLYESVMNLDNLFNKYTDNLNKFVKQNERYGAWAANTEKVDKPILNEIKNLKDRIEKLSIEGELRKNVDNYLNEITNVITNNSANVKKLFEANENISKFKKNSKVSLAYDDDGLLTGYHHAHSTTIERSKSSFDEMVENYKLAKEKLLANPINVAKKYDFSLLHNRIAEIKTEMEPIMEKLEPELAKIKEENQRVEQKLAKFYADKDYNAAIDLLEKYPGIFARNLDYLLRNYVRTDDVLESFGKVAAEISIPVLLQVKGHFARRDEEQEIRAFMPASTTAKVFIKENDIKPLDKTLCDSVVALCDQALITMFEGKESLNNVYIDEQFKKQYIPQGLRSATKGKETYVRGSRFTLEEANLEMEKQNAKYELELLEKELESNINRADELATNIENWTNEIKAIPREELSSKGIDMKILNEKIKSAEKELDQVEERISEIEIRKNELNEVLKEKDPAKAVRGFIWWTNAGKSDERYDAGRVDIDLSAVIFDEDCKYKDHVSYTNLRSDGFKACHSGDITNGGPVNGDGVAEFIDVDIDSILKNGGRYVVFQVNSFTGQHFCDLKNVKFGWMEREDLDKNDLFDPKTVKQRLDLSSDVAMITPVVFDCVTREFIWTDLTLNVGYCSNVESTKDKVSAMLKTITDPHKVNEYDLIMLNIEARGGNVVDTEAKLQAGDTAFVMDYPKVKTDGVKYVRPMDIDIILNDYMKEATIEEKESLKVVSETIEHCQENEER